MATPVSGANTWLLLNDKLLLFGDGEENLDAHVSEFQDNRFRLTRNAPDEEIEISIDQQPLETEIYGRWRWRTEGYAGLYEIRVSVRGYEDQVTHVRVVPQKLTQERYQKMQEDLSKIAADLLFRLHSPAREYVSSVKRFQDTSSLHDYVQAKRIFEQMQDTFVHILREPYSVLHTRLEQRQWHEIRHFGSECHALRGEVVRFSRHTSANKQSPTLHIPATWQEPQTALTYDVYENRLLKQFLQKQLIAKLNIIQDRARSEIQRRKVTLAYKQKNNFQDADEEQEEIIRLYHVIDDCQQMKRRCLHWSSTAFLAAVKGEAQSSKATQVLLKHPYYSRFYQLYLQFQSQLKISLTLEQYLTEMHMRKVSDFYEMWSVFQVTHLVVEELQANGYTLDIRNLFYKIEKNYFQFDVQRNTPNIILNKGTRRVEIKYEPKYPNHASTYQGLVAAIGKNRPLTPDMSIEIYQQSKPIAVLVFDAKYRWEKESDGLYYPKEEDMEKMSFYKDRIQYKYYNAPRKRHEEENIVRAAYILYPGDIVYEEGKGKIGGLPLKPEMSQQLLQNVRDQLNDLLYYAYLVD